MRHCCALLNMLAACLLGLLSIASAACAQDQGAAAAQSSAKPNEYAAPAEAVGEKKAEVVPTPVAAPAGEPKPGESAPPADGEKEPKKDGDKDKDGKDKDGKKDEAKKEEAKQDAKDGEKPADEELVDLYNDDKHGKQEGWAGWKKNFAPRSALNQDLIAVPDRWRMGSPSNAVRVQGSKWNPYRQNMLKGDYPIIGQSTFLTFSAISDTVVEAKRVPIPFGSTTRDPGGFDFFSNHNDIVNVQQNFILSMSLFNGETQFKPVDWEVRITPVFNVNYFRAREIGVVNIDPTHKVDRIDHQIAFQELFGEKHFVDLSPNYDFIAGSLGIQHFNADFRGFLFNDNEPEARVFGNLESNRIQYNLAYFEMLMKDTNSGLNTTFERKHEHVVIANVIRQDTIFKGYSIVGTLAYTDDEKGRHYNENGFPTEPVIIGSTAPNLVFGPGGLVNGGSPESQLQKANKVFYLGFGGEGHMGRINVSHQFYQALGKETFDPVAGRKQNINAQMASLELSADFDWQRVRGSFFYASGDHKYDNDTAHGFDSIFDNPNFAGGPFSYWVRQGLGFGNTATNLKSGNSLLPNLATSSGEGQANFVNPGIFIYSLGYDADLLPHLTAKLNMNYIEFDNTNVLENLLHQQGIDRKVGFDYSLGLIYRPLLNNNIQITGGISALQPLRGYSDIYDTKKVQYAGFLGITLKY